MNLSELGILIPVLSAVSFNLFYNKITYHVSLCHCNNKKCFKFHERYAVVGF